jgi:hypothetical protein
MVYLHAVLKANPEAVEAILEKCGLTAKEEARGKAQGEARGKKKKLTVDDVMEKFDLAAEWEELGRIAGETGRYWALAEFLCKIQQDFAQGEARGWRKAIALRKQGYTVEQLEQMGPDGVPPPLNS